MHINNKNLYRFGKDDMLRLCSALQIPEQYTCSQGTSATGVEAVMVLLRRLSYPNRLIDLVPFFGRAEPEISEIFSTVSNRPCKHELSCVYHYLLSIHTDHL